MMPRRWQDLEDDIRRLWRHVPLTPEKIERHAKYLNWLLSGDSWRWTGEHEYDEVIARFEELLLRQQEIEEFGALAAVLGFIPEFNAPTVPERLAAFAVGRMPKQAANSDTSTARRRAEKGAMLIAKRLYAELLVDGRGKVTVRISGTLEETYCLVTFKTSRKDELIQSKLESRSWKSWAEKPLQLPVSPIAEHIIASLDEDELNNEGTYVEYEAVCSMYDCFGQATLNIFLFEIQQPSVELIVRTDYPYRMFTSTSPAVFSITIEAADEARKQVFEHLDEKGVYYGQE